MSEKKKRLNLAAVFAALKMIQKLSRRFIPTMLFSAMLDAVKPFIPIVLSAKILDELMGGKDHTTLTRCFS